MTDCKTYWLHALTPVHVGVGFGSGFIDLPILREKITNWPLIPGSSVKGIQAEFFRTRIKEATGQRKTALQSLEKTAFGQGGDENANAGAIVFTDARIICLATRSYYGTFAYVTSPLVLNRLRRDAALAGSKLADLPQITLAAETAAVSGQDSQVWYAAARQVCLGELNLSCGVSEDLATWATAISSILFSGDAAWASIFAKRFTVVPDDTFDFLCETGCEVNARIKIQQDRKIVERGQFWYEESLPAESILAGLVWCDKVYSPGGSLKPAEILEGVCSDETVLQVGGKATVGKGRVRCCFGSAPVAENAHV